MLEFFRKYQRYFFVVITVVLIASFSFFGTYSTFDSGEKMPDRLIAQMIDGSDLMFSDIQKMSRFIETDAYDPIDPRGSLPNLCNDGVIRSDFLNARLADCLIATYFDQLRSDFELRLEKAKRFRPYVHPQLPFLSAKNIWEAILPDLNLEIESLQAETQVEPAVFSRFARLYQLQAKLHPEMLRKILIHQHQQHPNIPLDQRIFYEDFAVFGFHSASDWFGRNFVDMISEFILNAAQLAHQKGYRVSLEEAQGDLIHRFQTSADKLKKMGEALNFHQHLQALGFDVKTASKVWQKILLFRKLFNDIGSAAFLDRLPYKDFAEYAHENAHIQCYKWPIRIESRQDLAELETYVKAISSSKEGLFPTKICSVEEVEQRFPKLVETRYRADVVEVDPVQISLKVTLKELWQWQTSEKNWDRMRGKFSLSRADSVESRFKILNSLPFDVRQQVDLFAREQIVKEHPEWIEEALTQATKVEKTLSVLGSLRPNFEKEGFIVRAHNVEQVEKRILLFSEARKVLKEHVGALSSDRISQEKHPFVIASQTAMKDFKEDLENTKWIQSGTDPLFDQFKLERKQQSILRTSKEDWMKEQAFMTFSNFWSPIHLADDGQVIFFYLEEKKSNPEPILDQLIVGKETLAADAKAYFAQKLIEKVFTQNAIVIPVQKEEE